MSKMLMHATIPQIEDSLWTMLENLGCFKDNWRLSAEEKHRLDMAQSEINICLEHIHDRLLNEAKKEVTATSSEGE